MLDLLWISFLLFPTFFLFFFYADSLRHPVEKKMVFSMTLPHRIDLGSSGIAIKVLFAIFKVSKKKTKNVAKMVLNVNKEI